MFSAKPFLIVVVLSACAGGTAPAHTANRSHDLSMRTRAMPAVRAAARLGPPSSRGIGLRRIDRSNGAEPPLALY